MTVSVLVIPPATNANAYVTLTVADQYHADRPPVGDTWINAGDDEKVAAILWATRLFDSLYDWTGFVTSFDQPLQWPRQSMMQRNGLALVPSTSIPIELQYATAEYARQLLVSDRSGDSDIETQKIRSLTAGPVSFDFEAGVVAKPIPDAVYYLLPPNWGSPRGRAKNTLDLKRA